MTEKELFTNAMKKNMQDPSELLEDEILNPRKHARLRPSFGKYAAVAAVSALVIGAGAFFAFRDTDKLQTADDITPSAAQSAPTVSEFSDFGLRYYKEFCDELSSAPSDLYAIASNYTDLRRFSTDYSYTEENSYRLLPEQTVPKQVADFLSSAKDVEFLGYKKDNEFRVEAETLDPGIDDLLYSQAGSVVMIMKRSNAKNKRFLCCDIFVAEGNAYAVIADSIDPETVSSTRYYYKLTSADGTVPCFEGGKAFLPSWDTNSRDRSFIMTPEELLAQTGSRTFTVTDAEDRLGYSFTVDFSGGSVPVVDITDLSLPEGISIKDGRFTVQLETKENFGKHGTVNRTAELRTGKIDLSSLALDVDVNDIISVRVIANFDTTEHEAPPEYKSRTTADTSRYAYSLTAYVGGSRVTADS